MAETIVGDVVEGTAKTAGGVAGAAVGTTAGAVKGTAEGAEKCFDATEMPITCGTVGATGGAIKGTVEGAGEGARIGSRQAE